MKRSALFLPVSRVLGVVLSLVIVSSVRSEDPPVVVPADQLKALQEKASEVERLKAQLEAAQRELNSLKSAAPAPPPVSGGGKAPVWVPPAALRAQTNEPPPRPLNQLPPVDAQSVLSARELVSYFSENPAEAAQRFKGRRLMVRGVVTDVRKSLFQAQYELNFRQLDSPLRVTAMFRPPEEFTRVFASDDGEEMVGTGRGIRTVFARVGSTLTVQGFCEGLHDGAIRLTGCEYRVPAAQAR